MLNIWGVMQEESSIAKDLVDQLHKGLSDDLNTSPVLSALSEATKKINDYCHTKQVSSTASVTPLATRRRAMRG